jgi:hypothetical protein
VVFFGQFAVRFLHSLVLFCQGSRVHRTLDDDRGGVDNVGVVDVGIIVEVVALFDENE